MAITPSNSIKLDLTDVDIDILIVSQYIINKIGVVKYANLDDLVIWLTGNVVDKTIVGDSS